MNSIIASFCAGLIIGAVLFGFVGFVLAHLSWKGDCRISHTHVTWEGDLYGCFMAEKKK